LPLIEHLRRLIAGEVCIPFYDFKTASVTTTAQPCASARTKSS
jgi:hypothetical protein